MKITKASPADIPAIMDLIHKAVQDMQNGGLDQWDETYPNQEIITEDIAAGTLFKISTDGKIGGVVVLNEQYFPEYNTLKWQDNGGPYLIVHRLCIHPGFQGKGLAKKLMRFAEEYAAEKDYGSIRLDTFTVNKKALGLYDSLKYRRAGVITFIKGPFCCFEKVIK